MHGVWVLGGLPITSLQIIKRGSPPLGGGEVFLSFPTMKHLKPCDLTDVGLVKRIRGIAFTSKLSPQFANRCVDAARGILNQFTPNVFIYTDHYKGHESGKYNTVPFC